MNDKLTTSDNTLPTAAPKLYAQRANELLRTLDKAQDQVQALALDVDDPRTESVLSVGHDLYDLQHRVQTLIRLLGMTG